MIENQGKYAVHMVAGSNPEKFFISWIPSNPPLPGSSIAATPDMTEAETRDYLANKLGAPDDEIDRQIERGRANPRTR